MGTTTVDYTIDNTAGTAQLEVMAVTATNLTNVSMFGVVTGLPLNIAAGMSTTLQIAFDIVALGAFSFDMDITNNDTDENPYDIAVSGTGSTCPDLTMVQPNALTGMNSFCSGQAGPPTPGFYTGAPNNCPLGSSLQFSADGLNFGPFFPAYDQIGSQVIQTKCVCDNDNNVKSTFTGISVTEPAPNPCNGTVTFGSTNVLTFNDPCKCDDVRNCNAGGVFYFHDTLTIPSTGVIAAGLDIRFNSSTDFFIAVPCFGGALTTPTFGAAGTQIPESPAGSGVYKIEFWRPSGVLPTLSVLGGGIVTVAPASTFQPICTVAACSPLVPTLSHWGLIILGLLLVVIGTVAIRYQGVTSFKR